MLLRLLKGLDQELMPRTCAFCGVRCRPAETGLCTGCRQDLPRDVPRPPKPPFAAVVTPLRYEFPVDAAIKALKFRRRLSYVPAFGALLAESFDELPADIDALVPVPLHWFRHATRGFNQSMELCAALAAPIPVLSRIGRVRATPYQSGLDARKRRQNLKDAFRVTGTLRAQHPLIVDDVITTGATISSLAKVLLDAGAERVSALAVARA